MGVPTRCVENHEVDVVQKHCRLGYGLANVRANTLPARHARRDDGAYTRSQ